METRANFILIGVFTLLGFVGLMLFFAWFSKAELDRQFAYYDVHFTNVSGLDRASDVRFAGLNVGQVVDMALSERRDGTVRVRLEVSHDTPVRTDSVATIEAQGVTGVSYVAITAGSPEEPLLSDAGADVPEIEAGRSVLQTLSEDAPALLDEAVGVVEQISALLTEENRLRVENILINLEDSSAELSATLETFSDVAAGVGDSVGEIASFTQELEGISEAVKRTLDLAEGAVDAITEFSENAKVTLDAGTETLDSARQTLDVATAFIDEDLRGAVKDMTETSATFREQSVALGTQAGDLMDTWRDTGISATARLSEAESLLEETDVMLDDLTETLASVEQAADNFDTLVTTDGAALVTETREAVAGATGAIDAVTRAVEEDLPQIVADIRSATETANATITRVGEDLSGASGRLDDLSADATETLATVTATFARANETLASIDSALEVGERTLAAAESAFSGADRVINEDISGITSGLDGAIARLDAALAQVSEDLPVVTEELRTAADAARGAFADLASMVGEAEPAVRDFMRAGLPRYSTLAAETLELISTLDSLVRKIERDPARFFLNRQAPEYRR